MPLKEPLLPLTPLFASPYDLADRLPPLIADFLDLEITLRRRFREESVSDMIVASLLRLAGADLSVQVPSSEKVTGNDFDIIVYEPPTRNAVQYRIQAKRLTPHATNWGMGSYKELAHPHGTGTQSSALIRSSAAEKRILTIPLYAFYNPARTCTASGGSVNGLKLADGYAIRAQIAKLLKAKPKRPPVKRLATLHSLFFPLSTLLCPPSPVSERRILKPEESLRAVEGAIKAATRRQGGGETTPIIAAPDNVDAAFPKRIRSTRLGPTLPQVLALATARRQSSDSFVHADVRCPTIVLFAD